MNLNQEEIMKRVFIFAAVILLPVAAAVHAGSWKTEAVGGFSQVHIYTPDTLSPTGSGRSLLIALHGCLQSNEDMKGAKWQWVAETYGMVIALPEAMHKEGMGCWGYWTDPKSRDSKDYKNIAQLVKELLARSEAKIDSDQVYIAGLSSGGSFTMNVGCMMPDLFAGMGIDAGPSAGTSAACAITVKCGTVDETVEACRKLAGSYASHLDTQIASIAYGTWDYTVNKGYALQNAEAMAKIYGASKADEAEGPSATTITSWQIKGADAVSMAAVKNLGHAWPGGKGASGSYVDGSCFNYGAYLAEFFTRNNRRVKRK